MGPASWVLYILNSSGFTVGSGCSLMAAELQVFLSFLGALRAQRFTFGEPESLMTMIALFTDMAGILQFSVPWVPIYPITRCPTSTSPASSPTSSHLALSALSISYWTLLFCQHTRHSALALFLPLLGLCLPRCPSSSDRYAKPAFSVGRSSFQCCHSSPPFPVISFPAYFVS